LVIVGIEADEQVEHLVEHFGVATVGTVDLVDHHDRAQAQAQRLAGDEFRLRHRAFRTVDQQDHAVDHREDAFHFGAKVGVAGRVDDVDAVAVPLDRGRLGENGDPAFLFEIVRIHRPFLDPLVIAEGAGLAEKLINERGFAVVDVRDNRDIAHGKRGGHWVVYTFEESGGDASLHRTIGAPLSHAGHSGKAYRCPVVSQFSHNCGNSPLNYSK